MSKPSGLYPHSPDPALQRTARGVRAGAWRRKRVELCSWLGCSSAVSSRSQAKKGGQILHSGAQELILRPANGVIGERVR